MIIECINLNKKFGNLEVLKNINLEINKGEIISIIGPSGSGKSTLLRILANLEVVDSGEIINNGSIGMVFQNYNLFSNLSVIDNVKIGLIDYKKLCNDLAEKKANEMLCQVGLGAKQNNFPSQLSGGEKQRVSIARALAMESDIILFDEPTAALDPELTEEVLLTIRNLVKKDLTLIVVTHEIEFAKAISDRIIFMETGEIILDASLEEIGYNGDDRVKKYLKI